MRIPSVDGSPHSNHSQRQVGMTNNYIALSKFKLGRDFKKFKVALLKGRFSIRRDLSLIFLCGANITIGTPSARRSFLKDAIEKHLPHTKIVYAEKVLEELVKHGNAKNLLDIEHSISNIADWILIVLESYSSFCELGAFAHKELRKKLIVINDKNYKDEPSFINLGPIQAVIEEVGTNQVVWYGMSAHGVATLDSIGSTLPKIIEILSKKKSKSHVTINEVNPKSNSQTALYFLHDIIYLCGPISHAETVEIYKEIIQDKSFDTIKPLRGILHASELIHVKSIDGTSYYSTNTSETFLNLGPEAEKLLASFRSYHLRNNMARLIDA